MFELIKNIPMIIWYYYIFLIVMLVTAMIFFFKEKINEKWLKIFNPENIIKVIIHFPNGLFKTYYRIIPNNNMFTLKGATYIYSDEVIQKHKDNFIDTSGKPTKIEIEGTKYNFLEQCGIKKTFNKTIEIHFCENCPNPIDFRITSDSENSKDDEDNNLTITKFTAKELKQIKDNDLFVKLLNFSSQNNLLMLILLIILVNAGISAFLLANELGLLESFMG